eukprot:5115349-Amphidinium_carterae.1
MQPPDSRTPRRRLVGKQPVDNDDDMATSEPFDVSDQMDFAPPADVTSVAIGGPAEFTEELMKDGSGLETPAQRKRSPSRAGSPTFHAGTSTPNPEAKVRDTSPRKRRRFQFDDAQIACRTGRKTYMRPEGTVESVLPVLIPSLEMYHTTFTEMSSAVAEFFLPGRCKRPGTRPRFEASIPQVLPAQDALLKSSVTQETQIDAEEDEESLPVDHVGTAPTLNNPKLLQGAPTSLADVVAADGTEETDPEAAN